MTHDTDRDTRHNARMARKKDVVDDKIAAAQAERGVLLVNTGNGKGKSSAGFGLVARALGGGGGDLPVDHRLLALHALHVPRFPFVRPVLRFLHVSSLRRASERRAVARQAIEDQAVDVAQRN